ncbi:MAG: hypothetical protein DRQ40_00815 [Gammaproteobacteria bacterium]|nr:MAG: hypothetical protein DRQ40_00815 [Gammaproteobacteria bacterium]
MVLRMAILNTDADGAITLSNSWEHLYKNLDDFFNLLYDDQALVLSKYLADEATQREIDVEVIDEVQVKSEAADQRYLLDVPLLAARPFWRALPMITDLESSITGTRAFNIDIDGNAPTDDMIITIDCTSAGSTPALSVPLTEEVITIADGSISAGDQIVVNLRDREFTKNGVRYDQSVDHNRAWFIELPKGPATIGMEFTSISGTYNLKIERYDKWF